MKRDIILSGVGGQGILSIAAVIGQAALSCGLQVKQAEVHGMSQRGGEVHSNLRISSDEIFSDLIPRGGADLIISLEPMEALRYTPWLTAGGWIVTNTAPFKNIPNYPDESVILAELSSRQNAILLNINDLAAAEKLERSANMILLGAAVAVLGLEYDDIVRGIRTLFGRKGDKVVDDNLRALSLGIAAARDRNVE